MRTVYSKEHSKNGCFLTSLTLQVCITRCTLTQVAVDLIYTGTTVLTGCTGTLVYIWMLRNIKNKQDAMYHTEKIKVKGSLSKFERY